MLSYLIIDDLIKSALKEDMPFGDITTNSICKEPIPSSVSLIAKENGIICGIDVYSRVFQLIGKSEFIANFKDGDSVKSGDLIGTLIADASTILTGERVALNLLQRMSGIATLTKSYANKLDGLNTKVVDTRKTTPLYRYLDKYSVLCGGGANHRSSLSQAVMLKDNHIDFAGGIIEAVNLARKNSSFVCKIEVETETLEDVEKALEAKADIIMLDNMTPSLVAEMVKLIDGRAIIECSGNITLENIREYGESGVDIISVGALTHSFKVLDISMKNLKRL